MLSGENYAGPLEAGPVRVVVKCSEGQVRVHTLRITFSSRRTHTAPLRSASRKLQARPDANCAMQIVIKSSIHPAFVFLCDHKWHAVDEGDAMRVRYDPADRSNVMPESAIQVCRMMSMPRSRIITNDSRFCTSCTLFTRTDELRGPHSKQSL
eukprot:SAG11_NODE_1440_length_4905_cov_6.216188_5_plen_153_part_00